LWPTYAEGYGSLVCHWFIYARPNHKILLYFDDFEVEGNPGGKLARLIRFPAKLNMYIYVMCVLYES
jgi:hypothetical protein